MKKSLVFLLVGSLSALIDVGTLYFLNKMLSMNESLSISIAFFCGLIFNYFCHTYFTFNKSANTGNLVKYLIVVLVNYLVTISLIQLLQILSIDIVIAKVITLPIVAIITFLLSNKWVYK